MFSTKKEIYEFIDHQRPYYPLKLLCEVYETNRFSYASWKRRGISKHDARDNELRDSIEKLYHDSAGIYGSPKIYYKLKQKGIYTGKNRVARIMREIGLKARCSRIYRKHTNYDMFHARITNQIHEKKATKPNQIWVGDVTYLKVNKQWRYLAVVMDKYSRRIVGWSLSVKRNVALSLQAFKQATRKRLIKTGLYFHSDRGAEYVGFKYQNWLKKVGIEQSLNRKGKMNDNAEMESFFHQFKGEKYGKKNYTTDKELRGDIISYMQFYNRKRIHSSLGYLTPNEYEAIMM